MDETDKKILDILEEDARKSFTDIAEEADVSEGTVRNRVEKMLEAGVIEKFTVKRGSTASKAVVMVRLETGRDIESVLKEFPDVEVMEVAGEHDLILEIEKNSNPEINSVLDDIRSIEGVESTETYMVLQER
jgi:DNA-binding Lrp family transcriptional regulator